MRNSVSLPTNKHVATDPHEKPDRYGESSRGGAFIAKMKDTWASQSRSRWLKMGAIAMFVICIFYWLAPSHVSHPGKYTKEGGEAREDVKTREREAC